MTYPLVLDLAVDGIPVAVTCGLLGFSRQAFYSWKAHPVSERDLVDAYATNAALEVHREDPGFGYRFIADELADAGHAVSERRVWRLCSQAGSSRCTLASGAGPGSPGRRCTTTSSSGTSPRPARTGCG